jgi:hypothetical protein
MLCLCLSVSVSVSVSKDIEMFVSLLFVCGREFLAVYTQTLRIRFVKIVVQLFTCSLLCLFIYLLFIYLFVYSLVYLFIYYYNSYFNVCSCHAGVDRIPNILS